ncbi:MAG: hypothetical protein IJ348_05585 [Alistipes sp.]|nr:hypothetical protein [Alistipes sp.]
MNHNSRPLFAPLVITVIATLLSIVLVVVALIEWLAIIFDSFVVPCLLVALFMAMMAVVVYLYALRPSLVQARERFDIIYEVFRHIKRGVDWVQGLLGM